MGPEVGDFVQCVFRHHDVIVFTRIIASGFQFNHTSFPVFTSTSEPPEPTDLAVHTPATIAIGKDVPRCGVRAHHLSTQTEAGVEVFDQRLQAHEGGSGDGVSEFDFLPDDDRFRDQASVRPHREQMDVMVSCKGKGQHRSSNVKGSDDTDLSSAGHLQTPDEVNRDGEHKELGD